MVSKAQLIDEVLALVDAVPLTEVDVKPIIENHSVGLSFNEQGVLRRLLDSALADLDKIGDITRRNLNFSAFSGGQWMGSSGLVASTLKRKEKLEQIEREKNKTTTYQPTFNGPTNAVFGDGKFEDIRQSINEPKKSEKPKWLTLTFYWEEIVKFGWKWVIVVLVGTVSAYLGFHSSKDKELKKPSQSREQTQTPAQIDTTKKKDTADH